MNSIHTSASLEMELFYRIDINLYPLFISIYEQQSISKSAQILHISQSAVSHALQRLREHLNDDLFIRVNRKMCPTPFSEQIYPIIKNALISIQNISMRKQAFDVSEITKIKIAIHDEIEPIVLPKLVAHFKKLNLNIQFFSIKLDRKTILADLSSQQIDFVIDLEQSLNHHIEFVPLIQDHFITCSQHQAMDQMTYFSSPHIGVSSRRNGTLIEDVFFAKSNLSRNIFVRCQHYATALQILEYHPNAILTLPQYILLNMKDFEKLNVFDVPVKLPNLNIGFFWHKSLIDNSRHLFLRNEMIQIFA